MRTIPILVVAVCCILSCTVTDNTPGAVTTAFYKALMDHDVGAARAHLVNPDNLDEGDSAAFDIQEYAVSESSVNGDTATVETTTVNSGRTLSFTTVLQKHNDQWKVNLDKTMFNMVSASLRHRPPGDQN